MIYLSYSKLKMFHKISQRQRMEMRQYLLIYRNTTDILL